MKVISTSPLKRGQSGVIILEALIAIFIFSIGILGLVGALSAAVTNASEAQYRTEAAFLADSLIAEIRVSRNNPDTRATDFAPPSGSKYVTWKNRVTSGATALPGANNSANLPTVAFNNQNVTVSIYWQDKKDTSVQHKYVVVTALE